MECNRHEPPAQAQVQLGPIESRLPVENLGGLLDDEGHQAIEHVGAEESVAVEEHVQLLQGQHPFFVGDNVADEAADAGIDPHELVGDGGDLKQGDKTLGEGIEEGYV